MTHLDSLAAAVRRDRAAREQKRHVPHADPLVMPPPGPISAESAQLPEPADGIVARVGDRIVTTAELRARVGAIYRGPIADRLPPIGTPESVGIARWSVQLLVNETLVLAAAAEISGAQPDGAESDPEGADPEGATGAPVADNGASPARAHAVMQAAAEVFARVTAEITVPGTDVLQYYESNADLWQRPEGDGYRIATLDEVKDEIAGELLARARGLAFDEWLERRRTALVEFAPGYEHPGDPSHPDFVHRH